MKNRLRQLFMDATTTASSSGDDDDDGNWYDNYFPDSGYSNHTSVTTSVTIHVSPESFSFLSWSLLWFGFVLAIGLASYQIYKEYHWMTAQIRRMVHNQNANDLLEQGSTSVAGSHHRGSTIINHQHPPGVGYPPNPTRTRQPGNGQINVGSNGNGSGGDPELISTADMSRSLVRFIVLACYLA